MVRQSVTSTTKEKEDKELKKKESALFFQEKIKKTLEAGHSIRLGGRGRCGSASDQKHSHTGF